MKKCAKRHLLVAAILLWGVGQVRGEEGSEDAPLSEADIRAQFVEDVCARIESAANERNLPPAFFARLIWKESRFDPNAVSPKGASGIAQFMPGTARMRGLDDPFDPRSAIPASAHYLSDLRDEFGNLGLAAAAYNAGPNRVKRWRAGRGGLPSETRDFVLTITGVEAGAWNAAELPQAEYALDKDLTFLEACKQLPVRRFKPRFRYASYGSAPWQPWGVHLTSAWSPTKALAQYARIQRKYGGLLGGKDPMVLRTVNYTRGRAPRFRIQIGQPGRKQAQKFCNRLKRQGAVCLVVKTKGR
ncbi:MAG: lytic transglycosylase domain-containing protein [Hyphomicrobiaceae bacterium]|nr:lytic transglycosylase domain-containing protein [Hyphomicrobiaceae bacterium]